MGYYLELRTQKNIATRKEDLIARLKENKISEHPEYENTYLLDCGLLTINKDELINQGILAAIRISSALDRDDWQSLLDQTKKLGFRLYDPATNKYISKDSFKKTFETQRKVARAIIGFLGSTCPEKNQKS